MELLEWLAVVSFGAILFALIVGLFSAYNGRQTRSYIGDLILVMHPARADEGYFTLA